MIAKVKLNNGLTIPSLGLGTWQLPESEELVQSLVCALQMGYRYIDTAAIYENEASVGRAIVQSGLHRKDVFVLSKCWAANRSYDSVLRAAEESLRTLQLDYLDAYLIHWPFTKGDPLAWQSVNIGTWRAFERLYEEGLVKTIGVSNFQMHHLVSFLARANIKPAVNQIEFHPGFMQKNTVQLCRQHDINVLGWSPLGHGSVLDIPQIVEMAKRYEKSPAQIALRWCLEHNVIPVTRSLTAKHQEENLQIFDFKLTAEDVALIDALPITAFSGLEPDHVSF